MGSRSSFGRISALLRKVRSAGADMHDADEAVAATMDDLFANWDRVDEILAWARQAVVRYFVKYKTRNKGRDAMA